MEKLVLIREVIIERYIKVEYIRFEEELMRLRIQTVAILEWRKHEIAGCPRRIHSSSSACTASSKLCEKF